MALPEDFAARLALVVSWPSYTCIPTTLIRKHVCYREQVFEGYREKVYVYRQIGRQTMYGTCGRGNERTRGSAVSQTRSSVWVWKSFPTISKSSHIDSNETDYSSVPALFAYFIDIHRGEIQVLLRKGFSFLSLKAKLSFQLENLRSPSPRHANDYICQISLKAAAGDLPPPN
ncbi:unnamed protein product [Trichogramma brassicae]|uniref:Uncharacterized protein n=1 Tax=Trichogramma brassicae TaxID=86971 RepID=A0A6H5I5X9_9HYME|nr:unnamed protein product [Trichogramma brassicae]